MADPIRRQLEEAKRRTSLLAFDTEASSRMDIEPRDPADQPDPEPAPLPVVPMGPMSGHGMPRPTDLAAELRALATAVRDGRLANGASLDALDDLRHTQPGTRY